MKMTSLCKRIVDFTAAVLGLIVLSPVLVLISICIWISMGRPIFFRQVRPGYRTRPFTIVKFRTMTVGDTAATHTSDASRLTSLGAFLRRFSIDEIPQLWNVLIGDMSLVGPRPLLMEYLDRYTPDQGRRHDVKPGITGWAQIQGRQDILFSRRLMLDVWYVDHQSLWLDLKILLWTMSKMVHGSGVLSGQDVRDVDDLGLHPMMRREGSRHD